MHSDFKVRRSLSTIPTLFFFCCYLSPITVHASDFYVEQYRINFATSCFKEMSSGEDAVPVALARPICECQADILVNRYPEADLRALEARPADYVNMTQSLAEECFNKIAGVQ